ncbi:hypothetical protein [Streptomyces sp. Root1310]|uniref:hypothetical protein n=1 Tax=Streptomyces sp. Root1310 TaxID=1736452 RepID=UPI00070C16CB|nr:hypothetical protein [Streptomyces sp. Root1310]KQX68633.1 hypothetical protein ASD48_40965 [Streptomyces sp. Root1310]
MTTNQNPQNTSGAAQARTLAEARTAYDQLQKRVRILAILLGLAVGIIAALAAALIFIVNSAGVLATVGATSGAFLAATYFAHYLEEKAGLL